MEPIAQQHHIYHYFEIEAPVEEVFKAISNPTDLENWWPLKCSGTPELGATYNFNFTDTYNWFGEVVQIEAPHSFHIKMTAADEDWMATTFGFDLTFERNKTQVSFSHINWPQCNTHFKTASFCWAQLLAALKNYVEKGIVVPFKQRS